jgi:hypothetical protein
MPCHGEFQPSVHPGGRTRWSLRWGGSSKSSSKAKSPGTLTFEGRDYSPLSVKKPLSTGYLSEWILFR